LDDDADPALSSSQLLTTLVDGQSYVITETTANEAGFSLTDVVCVGGGDDTTVDIPGGVATIGFDAGETIACTFTNTAPDRPVVTPPASPPPTVTQPPPPPPTLSVTGIDPARTVGIGLLLTLVGLVALELARRRRAISA